MKMFNEIEIIKKKIKFVCRKLPIKKESFMFDAMKYPGEGGGFVSKIKHPSTAHQLAFNLKQSKYGFF